MVSIHDVARWSGVSSTTAKRAVRFPDLVAPETLARIREAIENLGYEPNLNAGALRRGYSSTVGLLVGNIVEPFFAHLIRAVSRELRSRGYAMVIADNEYKPEVAMAQLEMLSQHRVAGIILRSAFGEPPLDYLTRMQKRGISIIEIDYAFPGSPFGHVLLDNDGAVRQGVRYLKDLGHERIAALASYDSLLNPEERSHSFERAIVDEGLPPHPEYRRVLSLLDEATTYQFTRDLMSLPSPPTALFALTGNQAMGAYQALRELKLRIPEDVSLLTFDNYPWMSLVDPALDVIEQPVDAMGVAAVDALVKAIEYGAPAQSPKLRFTAKFIKRGSCGAPKPD